MLTLTEKEIEELQDSACLDGIAEALSILRNNRDKSVDELIELLRMKLNIAPT
jgi:hypothetical protein